MQTQGAKLIRKVKESCACPGIVSCPPEMGKSCEQVLLRGNRVQQSAAPPLEGLRDTVWLVIKWWHKLSWFLGSKNLCHCRVSWMSVKRKVTRYSGWLFQPQCLCCFFPLFLHQLLQWHPYWPRTLGLGSGHVYKSSMSVQPSSSPKVSEQLLKLDEQGVCIMYETEVCDAWCPWSWMFQCFPIHLPFKIIYF